MNDGRQRPERTEKGTCRDQGRRNKTRRDSGNVREESKKEWTQKINSQKEIKIETE